MTDARVIVVGLGGIGSAAAYWLSRRLGDEVLGIEQFEFGHGRGGSEDHSRIIRLSYHTPGYVELAKAAYDAWDQVEVDSGEPVVLRTGGLDLAPAGASIGLDDYRASMAAAGVDFEELEAAEIMRRWPQWRLNDDVTALFQDRSGIAMASRANAAHRRLARENGARLVDDAPVTAIREKGGEVEVVAGGTIHRADRLVVAAGAWTNRTLSHLGVNFPLDVTQEQVVYFQSPDLLAFHPQRFPVWIWMDEPCFYGFPVFGEPAVKVAWDRCEVLTDADGRSFEPDPATTAAIRGFADSHLAGAIGPVRMAKTCLYTLTPDRDFILDRVPGSERVFTAVGAGHAFKFASLLGRLLSDLALDGTTDTDLGPFRADRAILTHPNPARSYMV
ncbi:MAG TPA: N-methyl-L-tryptophan oxidase [Acidimicrobiia bacterium]|nr:N-methyl-L-tryptophan oxidase [Acidimicrobiia bacterium]